MKIRLFKFKRLNLVKFGLVVLILGYFLAGRGGTAWCNSIGVPAKPINENNYSGTVCSNGAKSVNVDINDDRNNKKFSKHVKLENVPLPANDEKMLVKVYPHGFSKDESTRSITAYFDESKKDEANENKTCSEIWRRPDGVYEFSFNPDFQGNGSNDWQENGFDVIIYFVKKDGNGTKKENGETKQDGDEVTQKDVPWNQVVVKRDVWRDEVTAQLSDTEPGCKYLKKIKFSGIPNDVIIDAARIWPLTSTVLGGTAWVPGSSIDKDSSEAVKFNADERSYEFLFNPALDCGLHWAKQVDESRINMNGFHVNLFLKRKNSDGSEGEAIAALAFEVSNEGLAQPKNLKALKNFNLSITKNSRGEDCFRIDGIPVDVEKVFVDVDYFVNGDNGKLDVDIKCNYENEIGTAECSVNENGELAQDSKYKSFYMRFKRPQKDFEGFYAVTVDFYDKEGYSYFLCKHHKLNENS